MVIYMEQYSAAKSTTAACVSEGTYGDEIMYANWNPAVLHVAREDLRAAAPELQHALSAVEAGDALDRVYALATLI